MTRILLIDDDEKLGKLLGTYFGRFDMELTAATRPSEGLELLRKEQPDLVVLDVMLPEQDGFEVCRTIRKTSAVPIVMLTARGDETDRIVGLEMGADDYLPKPFNARELLARIRAILRRSEGDDASDDAASLHIGPLHIDRGTRAVTVRGEPVGLTTVEFDILYALARSAGRVLSREQLLERVHGEGWAAYDRSIDVHISRIRHKIEDDPKKPALLMTIRGAGYQLVRADAS